MKKGIVLFIFCIALILDHLNAQSFYAAKRDRKFIASVGTGTSSYYGELSNDKDYMDTKLNLNIGLQLFINDRISTRVEITWFQLSGDDAEADDNSRKQRNLSFISNNYEINIEGIINLFPKGQRYYQRRPINAYAFIGIGMTYYNPKAQAPDEYNNFPLDDAGKNVALRPLQTEGVSYGSFTPVIPFGLGVKLKSGPFFNIALEGGFRKTFTDYLDDVSTTHIDNSTFTDPLAAAMADRRPELGLDVLQEGAKRGNPDADDAYLIMNIKIEYYLSPTGIFSGKKGFNKRRPNLKRYRRSKGR